MKRFIHKIIPPPQWQLPVIIILGIALGLSLYATYIARVPSYLSDQPETCVNCHIMAPQYATWNHSSHRQWASCNDCHVPHNNWVNHYAFKAKDGLRHATIFALRMEPQVIFIHEAGQKVVQSNCIRCHDPLLHNQPVIAKVPLRHQDLLDRRCWECHRETPHGRVNSLSSVPDARIPLPPSPVPQWLK